VERREYNVVDSFNVPLNSSPLPTLVHALSWRRYYELRGYNGELRITSEWIGNYDSEEYEQGLCYLIKLLFSVRGGGEEPKEPEIQIDTVFWTETESDF